MCTAETILAARGRTATRLAAAAVLIMRGTPRRKVARKTAPELPTSAQVRGKQAAVTSTLAVRLI
jgi:hypothetical protein